MASTAAKIAKEKGNASFKAGKFADAVGHYSAAVVADRTDPTYPLNRAAAYLKLGKHHDAERDCTTVLGLDGKNVKALFRRAQARVALESLAEAEKDLTDALQIEPTNDAVKQELAAVTKRKLDFATKQPSSKREPITIPSPSSSSSQPKTKPAETQPKRIIRNVPIEIVEADPPPPVAAVESSSDFLKPIQSRVISTSSTSRSELTPSTSTSSTPSASRSKPRVGAAIFRADGKHTIIREPTISPSPPPSDPPSSTHAPTPSHNITPARMSSPILPPPLTHFAFSRAWYALPASQERYDLLRRVPPESLPVLFKTSLEPALLVSILRTLADVMSPTTSHEIAEYMSAFPAVSRFSTVVLFLSVEEKVMVRKVWDALGEENTVRRREWAV